jgi:two-component system, NtrC family, nitrogen regulation response regulator GlnG
MSGDDSTLTVGPLDSLTGQAGLPTVPALTIVWHPHLDRIGHIAPLTNLLELDVAHVSRSEPTFFPPGADAGEALAHRFISKEPILDVVFTRGTFELRRLQEDQVEVDGQLLTAPRRVSADDLRSGLIITLARRIVLCLHAVHFPISRSPALGLLGTSDAIEDLRRSISRLANKATPVLLRGESGSGKEMAARALHFAGSRARGPFVAVNMGRLDRNRAVADLFGHKKGSFTGATDDQPGYFRSATGGTIVLDEIGYTTSDVQPMLLRVLDDQEVQPVGSSQTIKVDARIVAATDAHLEKAVSEQRFERPLYNRLNTAFVITLPPLRARREDVGVLLLHLLKKELGDPSELQRLQEPDPKVRPWLSARDVAAVARAALTANVRSLVGLARKLADTVGEGLTGDTHSEVRKFLLDDATSIVSPSARSLDAAEAPRPARYSEEHLLAALERSRWNRSKAAEVLGVGRTTLYDWLERAPPLRSVLGVSEPELRRRLNDAGGDVERLAAELGTTADLVNRRLAPKR